MDSGGFKVPVAALNLGRRKQISQKSQAIDDQAEQRSSKATLSPNEASPDISGDHEVSASGETCAGSDRDGQSSDTSSLDQGDSEAESPGRAKGEINDEMSNHDTADPPIDIDSTVREDATSSACDNGGRESGNDGRPHDSVTSAKNAESAVSHEGERLLPQIPYTVPHWSSDPPGEQAFSLSVIKNGTIIDELDLSGKAYLVFGRLPNCDVQLEHPSISRYHAVLQYRPASREEKEREGGESENHTVFSTNPREPGYYVYDLGSTHGTYLNKRRLDQRCYFRVRVGQMIKFGGSSRLFLLEVNNIQTGGLY